jgi:hypothetical protein
MKHLVVVFVCILLSLGVTTAVGDDPDNENSPWAGAVTFCDPDGLSVRELRQMCEDFWLYFHGLDLIPPVVVTNCPPDHAMNNGSKPLFTPNSFCPLECAEGENEITCSVMRWKD